MQEPRMTHLLVSVALSNVHTGQVGHDESPQFLVGSKLGREQLKKCKLAAHVKIVTALIHQTFCCALPLTH